MQLFPLLQLPTRSLCQSILYWCQSILYILYWFYTDFVVCASKNCSQKQFVYSYRQITNIFAFFLWLEKVEILRMEVACQKTWLSFHSLFASCKKLLPWPKRLRCNCLHHLNLFLGTTHIMLQERVFGEYRLLLDWKWETSWMCSTRYKIL